MAGNQTANFVVKAKDQASGPLGKIGTSMGKLRRTGITAFKGVAAASLAAATALAAFAADAIKAAMDDERQTILLNAALRQRGFDTKANAIAADIAAVTGTDLAEVVATIGKAAQGQTRGLKALGVQVKKGATLQDILTAASEKYSGIADEIANSTSGKLSRGQVRFNEAMENLGYKLLPEVNKVLDWLTTTGLPAFEQYIANVGPVYQAFIDEAITPLLDALGKVGKMLGTDMGTWAAAAELSLLPLKLLIQTLTAGLNLLAEAGKFFGIGSGQAKFESFVGAGSTGTVGTSYGAPGAVTFTTNVNIGTKKVDTVISDSINRTNPRGRNE